MSSINPQVHCVISIANFDKTNEFDEYLPEIDFGELIQQQDKQGKTLYVYLDSVEGNGVGFKSNKMKTMIPDLEKYNNSARIRAFSANTSYYDNNLLNDLIDEDFRNIQSKINDGFIEQGYYDTSGKQNIKKTKYTSIKVYCK